MPYDDQTEHFYWVDEADHVLGSMTRAEAHSGTLKYHRSVYALIFDQNGQLLMQKRSRHKDTYPHYWTVSTSGHVTYPMSYQEALRKEVKEEVGLELAEYEEKGKILFEGPQEREFGKIYFCTPTNFQVEPDGTEIDEIDWINPKHLSDWSKQNPLTPAAIQVLKHCQFL